jgi:membrane-bound lytic murein transglycosylase D
MMKDLKAVFTDEGVPFQLVWIAEVESGLNPRALNPSGAVGLFQLRSATAARFGLRTDTLDERLCPVSSARAAARYLRELYGQFGSWPLVIAAYNAGEGRVHEALAVANARTLDAAVRFLPEQTRGYVPRVMALIADREGTNPALLPPPGPAPSDSRG